MKRVIILTLALLLMAVAPVGAQGDDYLSFYEAVEIFADSAGDQPVVRVELNLDEGCWFFAMSNGGVVCVDARSGDIRVVREPMPGEPQIPLSEAIAIALEAHPDAGRVYAEIQPWPDVGKLVWAVFIGDDLEMYIDAMTGEIIEPDDKLAVTEEDIWRSAAENLPDHELLDVVLEQSDHGPIWVARFEDFEIVIDARTGEALRVPEELRDRFESAHRIDSEDAAIERVLEAFPDAPPVVEVWFEDDRGKWGLRLEDGRELWVVAATGEIVGFDQAIPEINIERAMHIAQEHHDAEIVEASLADWDEGLVWVVYFADGHEVFVHAATGEVVR